MRDGQYIATVPIKTTPVEDIITMMVNRKLTEQFPREAHTPGEVVLEVQNLKCGKSVKNVSFVARKGEILGFAGLMGSGRSETMRAIFGADIPEGGTIKINGKTVVNRSPAEAIAHGIGFLTEDRKNQGLILRQSVKNNITLTNLEGVMNKFGKIRLHAEEAVANQFIKELQIKTPGANQKVMYLSGGNQQKVVLAKWLNRDCKILIFDEPTRGIDVGAKAEIYKLMNKLVDRGIAVIMISSELPEILGMSDRIYVMHEGEITAELEIKNADQDTILKYASGARQFAEAI
jgi:ribose transport system ATP-binding protein